MQNANHEIFTEAKVQQEIRTAYAHFVASFPRVTSKANFSWKRHAHTCGDQCDFFFERNVVICKLTGNWHYCTQDTCDRMIANHEVQVCPLSGFTYPLDFVFSDFNYSRAARTVTGAEDTEHHEEEQEGGGEEEPALKTEKEASEEEQEEEEEHPSKKQRTESPVPCTARERMQERMQPVTLTPAEQTDEVEIRWDTEPKQTQLADDETSTSMLPAGEQAIAKRVDAANRDSRIALFETMLRKMFRGEEKTHQRLFNCIASNTERLWAFIQSNTPCTESDKHQRYTPEYHFLAVVYYMCHGYTCLRLEIIPFDAWIKAHIPQVRDLKRIKLARNEIKVKNYTQTCKRFKINMATILKTADARTRKQAEWTA